MNKKFSIHPFKNNLNKNFKKSCVPPKNYAQMVEQGLEFFNRLNKSYIFGRSGPYKFLLDGKFNPIILEHYEFWISQLTVIEHVLLFHLESKEEGVCFESEELRDPISKLLTQTRTIIKVATQSKTVLHDFINSEKQFKLNYFNFVVFLNYIIIVNDVREIWKLVKQDHLRIRSWLNSGFTLNPENEGQDSDEYDVDEDLINYVKYFTAFSKFSTLKTYLFKFLIVSRKNLIFL
jgi:hypothetical protein